MSEDLIPEIAERWYKVYPHYFSTYCIHGLHEQCRKRCKTCEYPCQCKAKECPCSTRRNIHDDIDAWHDAEYATISLHEYLGMTWEQYKLWAEKSILPEDSIYYNGE